MRPREGKPPPPPHTCRALARHGRLLLLLLLLRGCLLLLLLLLEAHHVLGRHRLLLSQQEGVHAEVRAPRLQALPLHLTNISRLLLESLTFDFSLKYFRQRLFQTNINMGQKRQA